MDYEKAHKEALERAKEELKTCGSLDCDAARLIFRLFPNLRESEDERIRRTLVEYFGPEVQLDFVRGVPIRKIRDWLEKQKEQKPVDFPTTDEEVKEFLETHPKVEVPEKYKTPDFVFSKQEYESHPIISKDTTSVKPAEWSEDWREEDIQTRFAFYTYKDDSSVLYLSNVFVEEASRNHGFGTRILRAAEKVAETIGATTICLKVKQDSPANAWYRKNGYGYVVFEDGYDWLEKNLEYMKPNKQEWSEEDELMIKCCFRAIEHYKYTGKPNVFCPSQFNIDGYLTSPEKVQTWLESLRNRVGKESLQPHWKPSEEQMKAFKGYIEDSQAMAEAAVGGWNNFDVMIRLYEQLKKL